MSAAMAQDSRIRTLEKRWKAIEKSRSAREKIYVAVGVGLFLSTWGGFLKYVLSASQP